ncbi:MAG: UDP-N-acetylglucosamine diphosphorylase/glucosamine-1-phosphate N-acetyltransferase, partial [Acidobacteria bacterium]
MSTLHVLILAAGKGTRMKSAAPKILHPVAGTPMIDYVLDTAGALGPATRTVVIGHGADQVKAALGGRQGVRFLLQEPQLGTAHALMQAAPLFDGVAGTLLLLYGDVPLLTAATLRRLLDTHLQAGAAATVVSAVVPDPSGYGRVIRDDEGGVARIVEHRDASEAERAVQEINAGIYAFDLATLFHALNRISANNSQREYYLPDLVGIYRADGRRVEALVADRPDEVLGINSRVELAAMSRRVWQARNEALMLAGVTIEDPATTYVDAGVTIGPDTTLKPGVTLQGRTRIGFNCIVHSGVRLVDSILDDRVTVLDSCLVLGAHIAEGAQVGPFAHLRPDTHVGRDARIGNFAELKQTRLG